MGNCNGKKRPQHTVDIDEQDPHPGASQYVYWDTHLVGCYHKAKPNAVTVGVSGKRALMSSTRGIQEVTLLQRTLCPEAIEELKKADENV